MIQEQKSKFDESAKKIQKAIDDDKAAGPFKWLKAIFEAIASVVMMIVGAVLIATGVGAAVGALMITAGVIGLVMAVDSMVQLGTGHGIMGNIVKACGGSEDQISKADMGFGIALGILGIGVAIVMMCIPGGQAMAAEEFADAGAMLAEEAVNTAEVVETATNTAAQIAQTVGNVTNVAAQVVDGVSTGITAGLEYDAAMNQAGALEDKADAKKMGALAAQLDDFIDMALQHMMSVHAGFENMMDNLMEAVQDKGQTMQHAKLSG